MLTVVPDAVEEVSFPPVYIPLTLFYLKFLPKILQRFSYWLYHKENTASLFVLHFTSLVLITCKIHNIFLHLLIASKNTASVEIQLIIDEQRFSMKTLIGFRHPYIELSVFLLDSKNKNSCKSARAPIFNCLF